MMVAYAGWLARDRERQLSMLGIDWRPDRAEADADWDARMTELLAFRRQQGHVQVTINATIVPSSTSLRGAVLRTVTGSA